jgi:hypothetical protein
MTDVVAERKCEKRLRRLEKRLSLRTKKRNNKAYRTRPH